jgi:uncharacterized membrane protein
MAGTQRQKARSSQTRKAAHAARGNGRPEPTPGDYAREAVSEWAKAARYAVAALSPALKGAGAKGKVGRPPLKDRLNPAKTDKGGRLGNMADFLLDKTGGKAGTVASKLGAGSRIVGGLRGDNSQAKGGGQRSDGSAEKAPSFKELPVPIQESMEVALPIKAVYTLARRFEDYPEFLDRVEAVESIGKKTTIFDVKVRGINRSVRVEIADERPNRRIDWEATEGLEHSGVVSFHELAPSLTHVELTVDLEPHGLVRRLARATHITHHSIRSEMHRFKAWAELAEDVEEPEEGPDRDASAGEEEPPEDSYEDEEEEEDEDEPEDLEDEEEFPEDYEDEGLGEPGPEEDYEEPDMEYEGYDDEEEEDEEEEEETAPARAR